MINQSLERVTPESVGISSGRVKLCLEKLMHSRTAMHGFMAARYGKVFAEGWWKPYSAEMVHSNHSFGKSYTATAVGIAVQEGKLSLDERMVDIFAEEIRERCIKVSDLMKKVTVYHVLTMSSGHAYHPPVTEDWIGDYFRTPVIYEPGSRFLYNSSGSFLLGAILLKKTGENLKEYLTPRLFEKIGIDAERFVWLKFPNGIDAEPGTFATTEDNLRLAMLYCNGGSWNGEQIVSKDFIKEALQVHTENPYAPEQKDGRCGYGYQLWACSIPGVYRFDGGQGQYGIICPRERLVIAIHEGAMMPYGPQQTLDILYKELFPALRQEAMPEDPIEYEELIQLEKSLSMPEDEANIICPTENFRGSFRVTEGEMDLWLGIAPPGGTDFFRLFRKRKNPAAEFTLETDESGCTLGLEGSYVYRAGFDGAWRLYQTEDVFEGLGKYCATARYINENTLEITIHWMNSWAQTVVRFEKWGEEIWFTIMKLRLHEEANWLVTHGKAVLIKEEN